MKKDFTALIIMDGFGERAEKEGNAIAIAGTPRIDAFKSAYPHTLIGASGLSVGLPDGSRSYEYRRGENCISGTNSNF